MAREVVITDEAGQTYPAYALETKATKGDDVEVIGSGLHATFNPNTGKAIYPADAVEVGLKLK